MSEKATQTAKVARTYLQRQGHNNGTLILPAVCDNRGFRQTNVTPWPYIVTQNESESTPHMKCAIYIYVSIYTYSSLRHMFDAKSRGWCKLMRRNTKVAQQQSQLIFVWGSMVEEKTGQEFLATTINYIYICERQLWDQGFRRNSSLQAVWNILIARTTGLMWDQGR